MTEKETVGNGEALAAILASGIGCLAFGALTASSETIGSLRPFLAFYGRAGPLTGQSTVAVVTWLASWAFLHSSWKNRQLDGDKIFLWTLVMVACGLIGTFPPPFEELGEWLRGMLHG